MKIFLALVLLAALASAEIEPKDEESSKDQKTPDYEKSYDERKKHREECVKELEISAAKMEEYEKMFQKETINVHYNDSTLHCFVKCLFEKQHIFDDKNSFNLKEFKKLVLNDRFPPSSDEVEIMFENCKYEFYQATEVCERAFRGVICVFRQYTEHLRNRFSYRD